MEVKKRKKRHKAPKGVSTAPRARAGVSLTKLSAESIEHDDMFELMERKKKKANEVPVNKFLLIQ